MYFMLLALVVSISTAATPMIAYAEWKTYNNTNLKFAINYLDTWGFSKDPVKVTETKDSVNFNMMPHLSTTISSYGKGLSAETWAQAMQNDQLKNTQDELVEGVTKVEYNGQTGYRFILDDPLDKIYKVLIYFDTPNGIYEAKFIGYDPIGGIRSPMIDAMTKTIKFFE